MFYSFLSQHLQNMGRNYPIKKGKAHSLWLTAPKIRNHKNQIFQFRIWKVLKLQAIV